MNNMLVVALYLLMITVHEVTGQQNLTNLTTTSSMAPSVVSQVRTVRNYSANALSTRSTYVKFLKNEMCRGVVIEKEKKSRQNLTTLHCEDKIFVVTRHKRKIERPKSFDIWKLCTEFGLIPSRVESRQCLVCLYEAYKNATKETGNKTDIFYTSYFDYDMKQNFLTCPDKKAINPELWAPGEPNNDKGEETNVGIKITPPFESIGYYDVDGNVGFEILCQSPINEKALNTSGNTTLLGSGGITKLNSRNESTTTKAPIRTTKIATPYNKQTIAEQKFVMKMNNNDPCKLICKPKSLKSTINKRKHLVTMQCENKTFVVSNTTANEKPTGMTLFSTCCELGLILSRVDTREGLMCLYESYKNITGDSRNRNDTFFLNYGDMFTSRRFISCPDLSLVNDDLFAPDEPDNKNGIETNIQVKITPPLESIGFYDVNAKLRNEVLCQHPPPIVAAVNITNTTRSNNNTSSKNITQSSTFNLTTVTMQLSTTTTQQYRTTVTVRALPPVLTTPPIYYLQPTTNNYMGPTPPTYLNTIRPGPPFG